MGLLTRRSMWFWSFGVEEVDNTLSSTRSRETSATTTHVLSTLIREEPVKSRTVERIELTTQHTYHAAVGSESRSRAVMVTLSARRAVRFI